MTEAAISHALDVAREPRNWLRYGARLGYAARGFVYVLVGGLALLAAVGAGGHAGPHGSRSAIATLLNRPFGVALLAVLASGLAGFALWRLCQSVLNADRHSRDARGFAIRAGLFFSSIAHWLLAAYTINLIIGAAKARVDEEQRIDEFSAWLLSKPLGAWALGVFGAAVIAAALVQMVKGGKGGYGKWLKLDADQMRWASPVCRVGLIARGLAFLIIGGLLVFAAATAQPEEATGLGGVLSSLRRQPYGPWLLAAMAVGRLAFAGYSMIEAAFRRVEAPRTADISGV
jgi:hypothetical protein